MELEQLVTAQFDGAESEAANKVILNRAASIFTIHDFYPNPVSDILIVELESDLDENFDVTVYDHSGKKIFAQQYSANGNISNIEINTNDLSAGTYILSINNGTNTLTERFVKQ